MFPVYNAGLLQQSSAENVDVSMKLQFEPIGREKSIELTGEEGAWGFVGNCVDTLQNADSKLLWEDGRCRLILTLLSAST